MAAVLAPPARPHADPAAPQRPAGLTPRECRLVLRLQHYIDNLDLGAAISLGDDATRLGVY